MAKIVDTTGVTLYENYAKGFFDTLQEASDDGIVLNFVYLYGMSLHGIDLTDTTLTGADMSLIGLHNACLNNSDLSGANLWRADLSGADLRGAWLRGANLSGADLSGANLGGADLRGASLTDVDISGANLSGADLYGARVFYNDGSMSTGKMATLLKKAEKLWGVPCAQLEITHNQRSWARGFVQDNLIIIVKEDKGENNG